MPEETPIIPTVGQLSQPDPQRLFAKGITQYNPSDLVGRKGLRVFDAMRKDEQVKSSIAFKKFSVIAAGYDIVSPEGRPGDWEPTEFCNWSFDNLPGSITDRILMMLTAIEYGYSASELVWGEPLKGGPFSGKWPLEDIVSIKPHSFRFEQDQQGKMSEIIQDNIGQEIHIPIEKVVLMTYQNEWSNPYGRSDFEAAHRAFWCKDSTHKWLAMLLERFGIPPIFAKYNYNLYPEGPVLDAFRQSLTNLQAGTVATLAVRDPKDIELWSPALAAHVQDVFIPALDRYDNEIARAILMPNLLGTTPEQQQGSFARAAVVFDVFLMAVDALRKQVEECINDQIIWRMMAINYPTDENEYPRFKLKPLTQDARIDLMDTWVKLVGGGAVLAREADEVHVREILGFPEAESEPIPPPEPEAAAGGDEDEGGKEKPASQPPKFSQEFRESLRSMMGKSDHIDFKAIEKRLDANEQSFIAEAKDDLEQVLIILQKNLKAGQQPTSVTSIRGMSPFQASLRLMLMGAFEDGRNDLVSEVGPVTKLQAFPRVKPRDAIAFLKRKAITLTATVEDEILRDVRRILIAAVESGMDTSETVEALGVVFEKWIGSPNLRDGQVIKPYRLESIARTECLVGTTRVSGAVVRAAYRRWYHGSVVEVVTKRGRKFTATPNHPMLSRRGWVGAGKLRPGDDLVGYCGEQDSGPGGDKDIHHSPATIDQVFGSLEAVGVCERRPGVKVDFHGDGADGNVDILTSGRTLKIGSFASVHEPLGKKIFTPSSLLRSSFCSFCDRLFPMEERACCCGMRAQLYASLFKAVDYWLTRCFIQVSKAVDAFPGFVYLREFLLGQALNIVRMSGLVHVDRGFRPCSPTDAFSFQKGQYPVFANPQSFGYHGDAHAFAVLGDSARTIEGREVVQSGIRWRTSNPRLFEGLPYPMVGDTQTSSYVRHAQPRDIEFDSVISVEAREYCGHVYNLSTPDGYFCIDGLYTGNTTAAYNHGRVVAARDPELKGLIRAMRYDAILDSRTSSICLSLSGRLLRVDSKELDELQPPNHTNCRSILVPLTISQTIDEKGFLSPSEVGRAKELAGSGFAGGGSF